MTSLCHRLSVVTAVAVLCALAAAAAPAQDVIDLPDFGDSAGAIISPDQERRLGEDFMRQLRRLAPIVDDEEIEDYIQKLGESMSDKADYYGDFTFFVIDSPVINAFAVPGGFIAFHTGLILETRSEAELEAAEEMEVDDETALRRGRRAAGQRAAAEEEEEEDEDDDDDDESGGEGGGGDDDGISASGSWQRRVGDKEVGYDGAQRPLWLEFHHSLRRSPRRGWLRLAKITPVLRPQKVATRFR